MSLKMAQKVIVPQKKNYVRSFLNSGTLIVKKVIHFRIAPRKIVLKVNDNVLFWCNR